MYIHDNSDKVEDDAEMTMKLDLPNVSTMELDRHNHKCNRITNSSKGGMEDDEDKGGGGEFLDVCKLQVIYITKLFRDVIFGFVVDNIV